MDGRHDFRGGPRDYRESHERNRARRLTDRGAIAYATDEVDFDLVLSPTDGQTRRTMLVTARNELTQPGRPRAINSPSSPIVPARIEIWARSRDG